MAAPSYGGLSPVNWCIWHLLIVIVEALVSMTRLQRKHQKAWYSCAVRNVTLLLVRLLLRLSFFYFWLQLWQLFSYYRVHW